MTDCTTAQLATILSALAGSERKPATKAAAMRAIARQAAAIDLIIEQVLAAAPGLLNGRIDPTTWRDQLTAGGQPNKIEGVGCDGLSSKSLMPQTSRPSASRQVPNFSTWASPTASRAGASRSSGQT